MPHTDTIPVSASIASTGLGIRYVGNWAYGYSGIVSVGNSETDLLNTTTGSGIIKLNCTFTYTDPNDDYTADNYTFKIYLNAEQVMALAYTASGTTDTPYTVNLPLILPPFTTLRITAINRQDASLNNCAATVTGRVYGAE